MKRLFEPEGMELDYVLSKDFKDAQIVKNAAIMQISLKKDNDARDLIFKENFGTNKQVLKEVNELGKIEYMYYFFNDINKNLIALSSIKKQGK